MMLNDIFYDFLQFLNCVSVDKLQFLSFIFAVLLSLLSTFYSTYGREGHYASAYKSSAQIGANDLEISQFL